MVNIPLYNHSSSKFEKKAAGLFFVPLLVLWEAIALDTPTRNNPSKFERKAAGCVLFKSGDIFINIPFKNVINN